MNLGGYHSLVFTESFKSTTKVLKTFKAVLFPKRLEIKLKNLENGELQKISIFEILTLESKRYSNRIVKLCLKFQT